MGSVLPAPHLDGKHDESHEDHDDDQQLRGPDFGRDVPEAHRGEGDHAEVERVEQRQVVASSLQVLDTTDTEEGEKEEEEEDVRHKDRKRQRQFQIKMQNYCVIMNTIELARKLSVDSVWLLLWFVSSPQFFSFPPP